MTRKISIDPITRLEGHGKIEIFLDDSGAVEETFFQIPELRGFERFVVGRPIEELPRIVTRICGVCPASHHMASAKAVDGCFGGQVAPLAHKLRDMYYNAHYIHSHIAHFYALAAPDFVLGPDSDPAERNVLGVVHKVGLEIGGAVIKSRGQAQEIQRIIGGRNTQDIWCLPGGVAKGLKRGELEQIKPWVDELYDFTQFSLQLFRDVVLANKTYVDIIVNGPYTLDVHSMGLVDENNAPNFYDGRVRVVDFEGEEICSYTPTEYADYVAEHVEPWSYLKFPYLKQRGWKGFVEGIDTSIYCATPLGRLNVADRMATPKAQEAFEEMFTTLGGHPCRLLLANHWARLVEMVQNAETLQKYCADPEITGDGFRVIPDRITGEGVGIVEAMRGTLTHHYTCDERAICTSANLIVGTTNNNAPIQMVTKKVAQHLIKPGVEPDQGILNMIEMAFRAFDPCYSCATHSLPGEMPLDVQVYKHGEPYRRSGRPRLDGHARGQGAQTRTRVRRREHRSPGHGQPHPRRRRRRDTPGARRTRARRKPTRRGLRRGVLCGRAEPARPDGRSREAGRDRLDQDGRRTTGNVVPLRRLLAARDDEPAQRARREFRHDPAARPRNGDGPAR
jgi:F420-non-reducing hydrogenase large subunit